MNCTVLHAVGYHASNKRTSNTSKYNFTEFG